MWIRGLAAALLACAPAAAQSPGYSIEKEAALGQRLAQEHRRRTTAIENSLVQKYVDALGARLARHMWDLRTPFTLGVTADRACAGLHEPRALPGGYIFVSSAMFVAAEEETEFAGMLAHAMAHVVHGFPSRRVSRGQIINHTGVPLVFAGAWTAGCAESLAIPRGLVEAQRKEELEADIWAMRAMSSAGIDPVALVRYVERRQVRPTGTGSRNFSPLPDKDERLAAMWAAIETLPRIDYEEPSPDAFVEARRLVTPAVR